jgi:hypothetical protein
MNEDDLDLLNEGSWGKECDEGVGLCFNGLKIRWCAGQQPCYGGGVGAIGIMAMDWAALSACKDKFWGTWVKDEGDINGLEITGLKLIEVGMLAEAGLEKGDILSAIIEDRDACLIRSVDDRQLIFTWQFIEPVLRIVYERLGGTRIGMMKNPAAVKGGE